MFTVADDNGLIGTFKEDKFSFEPGVDGLLKEILNNVSDASKRKPQEGDPELALAIAIEDAGFDVDVVPDSGPEVEDIEY